MEPQYQISYRKPGPFGQILSFIVGVALLIAAFIIGIYVLAILLGLIVIGGIVLAIRVWWARRQVEKAVRDGKSPSDVVQGDFIVVERRRNDPKP